MLTKWLILWTALQSWAAASNTKLVSFFHPGPACRANLIVTEEVVLKDLDVVKCGSLCQARSETCRAIRLIQASQVCQLLDMEPIVCSHLTMSGDPIQGDIRIASYAFEPPKSIPFFAVPSNVDGPLMQLDSKQAGFKLPVWTDISIWAEYQGGILACSSELDTNCQFLDLSLGDSWGYFPPLKLVHSGGVMGTLDGIPYVIGGCNVSNPTDSTPSHNQVEYYNKETEEWVFGPHLNEAKRAMTLVQISAHQIMIIAGHSSGTKLTNRVEVLSTGSIFWEVLPPYPRAWYEPLATKIVLSDGTQGVLTMGGKNKTNPNLESEALFMDSSNTVWRKIPEFDFPIGCQAGNAHFHNGTVYLFPKKTGPEDPNDILYQKTFEDASWTTKLLTISSGTLSTGIVFEATIRLPK